MKAYFSQLPQDPMALKSRVRSSESPHSVRQAGRQKNEPHDDPRPLGNLHTEDAFH